MRQSTPEHTDEQFTIFVTENRGSLMHTAYLLTGSETAADDLLQDALVKVYLAWSRVEPRLAWAYTRRVMVNLSTDRWRRKRYEAVPSEISDAHRDARADADFANLEVRDEVLQQLARLNPRERAIVVLRYYHDLAEAEVAEQLGVSIGTVKSTASRALAKLRRDALGSGVTA